MYLPSIVPNTILHVPLYNTFHFTIKLSMYTQKKKRNKNLRTAHQNDNDTTNNNTINSNRFSGSWKRWSHQTRN